MTSSPVGSPSGPFAPMQLIRIQGYTWCEAQHTNIYMAAISPNPADHTPHGEGGGSLLGLFPFSGKAEFRDSAEYERMLKKVKQAGRALYEGWMGLALSCDGVRFSSIVKLTR